MPSKAKSQNRCLPLGKGVGGCMCAHLLGIRRVSFERATRVYEEYSQQVFSIATTWAVKLPVQKSHATANSSCCNLGDLGPSAITKPFAKLGRHGAVNWRRTIWPKSICSSLSCCAEAGGNTAVAACWRGRAPAKRGAGGCSEDVPWNETQLL